jgi:hypothetical protein
MKVTLAKCYNTSKTKGMSSDLSDSCQNGFVIEPVVFLKTKQNLKKHLVGIWLV